MIKKLKGDVVIDKGYYKCVMGVLGTHLDIYYDEYFASRSVLVWFDVWAWLSDGDFDA